jgi:hypothetical protein
VVKAIDDPFHKIRRYLITLDEDKETSDEGTSSCFTSSSTKPPRRSRHFRSSSARLSTLGGGRAGDGLCDHPMITEHCECLRRVRHNGAAHVREILYPGLPCNAATGETAGWRLLITRFRVRVPRGVQTVAVITTLSLVSEHS